MAKVQPSAVAPAQKSVGKRRNLIKRHNSTLWSHIIFPINVKIPQVGLSVTYLLNALRNSCSGLPGEGQVT